MSNLPVGSHEILTFAGILASDPCDAALVEVFVVLLPGSIYKLSMRKERSTNLSERITFHHDFKPLR